VSTTAEGKAQVTVMVVDDEPRVCRLFEKVLREEGYRTITASGGREALALAVDARPDLILLDIVMPGMDGVETLRELRRRGDAVVVIMLTAQGSLQTAREAMLLGAYDYVTKPFNRDELRMTLEKALRMRRLEHENSELRTELKGRHRFEEIIGQSERIRAVLDTATRVAASDASVLITGESGTGKELLARGIHYNSPRADGPFIAVNCAAIPENLIESELFGHVKGSFTGAIRDKEGKFELADGGTLFLDEIGELRVDLQAKILRALQERTVDRVGGSRPVPADARVIAATNRDIEKAVKDGTFREDIYYRLSVVTLQMPPLRERRDDIPLLIEHFLRKHGKGAPVSLEPAAQGVLRAHAWPGNVRELENVIERALLLKQGSAITLADLPEKLVKRTAGVEDILLNLPEEGIRLEELEKNLIIKALERHKGNQTRAAEFLGITRPTLIYRMEKYGLKPA